MGELDDYHEGSVAVFVWHLCGVSLGYLVTLLLLGFYIVGGNSVRREK